MQDELVYALRILQPHVDKERIQRVLDEIALAVVPPDDYENMIHFIHLLLEQLPEIPQARPYDDPLKALCIACFMQLGYSPLFKP